MTRGSWARDQRGRENLFFPPSENLIIIRSEPMISQALIDSVLAEYSLPLEGIHGLAHWARVLENGRRLAARTGVKIAVVELFALFHDARRVNEGRDDGHGPRAAELARILGKRDFHLPDPDLDLLISACAYHTAGRTDGEITEQTCWDADRLDLYRVGIRPHADYLCTAAAKTPQIIRWAMERSTRPLSPARVAREWGIDLGPR
jgi:uncharacterized protein